MLPRRWKLSLTVLALVVLPSSGFAKMYEEPKSFSLRDKSLQRIDRKVLKAVEVERLLAEDRARRKDRQRPEPERFAVAQDVAFDLGNSGTWQDLPDGRLWRLRIHSPGAVSHNLGITRFDIPEGAQLWIYDPAGKDVEGPYTSRHRSRHGRLWTPVIGGDEIVVELFVPRGVAEPRLQIGRVNQGYHGLKAPGDDPQEGPCNIDVICPQGAPFANQIRAVGVYTLNGVAQCTGTMLNNTAVDFTPYFLSANHCAVDATNDDTVVVYWNFESPVCNDHGPGSLDDNQTGSTFRAANAPSDFLLLELSDVPDPAFNVFYAGWDRSGVAPPGVAGIHHPRTDEKAISFANTAPVSTAYFSDTPDPAANHWRVAWDVLGPNGQTAITEPGSSGSCIFASDTARCIGQLHGGPSFCGAQPEDLNDFYGKFSVSWTGGGTAATRLSDWLDPGNTGVMGLDGDPHLTTLDGTHYDFQGAGEFVALRDATGVEIQARQAPIATTFNPGANAHTGLATCVSLNTAVAARVGKRRVTYQPNLSGVPDPNGLQLRVDGELQTLGPAGIDLGNGGRIAQTAAPGGIDVIFPDRYVLTVTPGWWSSQSKWYLNIGVVRTADDAISGASPGPPTGGLVGAIPRGSWLPALPDGSSMGPRPAALHDRYVDLYQKFGQAWRVTDSTSLFDYAPGTSTDTFTLETWPMESPPCVLPQTTPVKPLSLAAAERACRRIADRNTRANCVFDVRVTGEPGFAKTYLAGAGVLSGSTTTTVRDDREATKYGEPVTFIATVARRTPRLTGSPTGAVQFTVDGQKTGEPVRLDARGRAVWTTTSLKPGTHKVAAIYIPTSKSVFLPSNSPDEPHLVTAANY
ncbi:MAG TPA: Ig-like domain repeat protein [Thermoanaerobaculia bacterium]|nr:Ig-like domain repeat protein [Thermoanaerobaculia bacterium]